MTIVVHTSRASIRKHVGAHRSAEFAALDEPVHYGMHGGILQFYRDEYVTDVEREYPATLDKAIDGCVRVTSQLEANES